MYMRMFCITLLLFFLSICTYAQTTFWDDLPDEICAERITDEMSAEELLGQALMFGYGWNGYKWADVSEDLDSWIKDNTIGNMKVFGWNGSDLNRLAFEITEMQKLSQKTKHKVPLIIATDQEGGWVRHIKGTTIITPGNLAIGATSIMQDAYLSGYYIAKELKALGINMNFAPDVDLFTNFDNITIGPRTFSDNPEMTGKLGLAFYLGTRTAGVIATAKHYPGHGDTNVDSHGKLPVIYIDFNTWWDRELVPYRLLINEGIPAIMSGHLEYPAITQKEIPASLSGYLINGILKNRLGFDGIVISDDLEMDGALSFADYNMGKTCYYALDAGNDIALLSRTNTVQKKAHQYLLEKMNSDSGFYNSIKQKAYRVIILKLEYLKKDGPEALYPDLQRIDEKIPDRDGKKFFLDLAYRSTTIIRNSDIPIQPDSAGKILVAGQKDAFFEQAASNFPDAEKFSFYYVYYKDDAKIENVKKKLNSIKNDYDTIIFCLDTPGANVILDELKDSKAAVYVLSVLSPTFIRDNSWVDNYIEAYCFGNYSIQAAFDAMTGKFIPSGVVPLQMDSGN